jgi:hypothetical protein
MSGVGAVLEDDYPSVQVRVGDLDPLTNFLKLSRHFGPERVESLANAGHGFGYDLDLMAVVFSEDFHSTETLVHGIESLSNAIELRGDELHQLLVLALGHLASSFMPLTRVRDRSRQGTTNFAAARCSNGTTLPVAHR